MPWNCQFNRTLKSKTTWWSPRSFFSIFLNLTFGSFFSYFIVCTIFNHSVRILIIKLNIKVYDGLTHSWPGDPESPETKPPELLKVTFLNRANPLTNVGEYVDGQWFIFQSCPIQPSPSTGWPNPTQPNWNLKISTQSNPTERWSSVVVKVKIQRPRTRPRPGPSTPRPRPRPGPCKAKAEAWTLETKTKARILESNRPISRPHMTHNLMPIYHTPLTWRLHQSVSHSCLLIHH